MKNKNYNLFFYGMFANFLQFIGCCIIVLGFFLFFLYGGWIGGLSGVIGLTLFIFGKAKRFDYQRRSGNILHRGDW